MWTRLTFYSPRERCCVAIVGLTPCPYLLLTHFPRCCCVTWVLKILFFRPSVDPVLPGGLDRSPLLTSLKPMYVQRELSLLSSAPSLHKPTTMCPLNVFHLSYCPSWQTTNKQTATGIFLTLSLPVFTHSSCTHTPATSSYTCAELAKVVWIHCNRTKHPLLWCTDALPTPVCPPKTAASSPPGAAPHIYNTLLSARWLSLQVLFPINQTVFELINNKSISRCLEMRVSRGRCLFVRQTSAALSLSAMKLALSFTLETWLADCHKSRYQL